MRRGQGTLEYLLIIALSTAALISMGIYIKRGFQGNIRNLSDEMGEQYDPGNMTSDITSITSASIAESTGSDDTRTTSGTSQVTTTSTERLGSYANE